MAEVTRGAWAKRFCNERDLTASQRRLNALVAWETAEGTAAKFNPLATTWDMPNDSMFNSVGVRNYATLKDGLKATWLTLEKGQASFGYAGIVEALEENFPALAILQAVADSAWGTGALAKLILPDVKANYDRYAARLIGQ